jgi:dolichol-phosphate mannosyltransferase
MTRSDAALGIACPMANEGPDGARFVEEVLRHCDGFRRVEFFAILDKATKDNSLELLRDLATREPRLRVIWAPENRNVVDAYFRGYREALNAGNDWILEIDAGFSHQPTDLAAFFTAMEQGYDCVFGSRFMKGARVTESTLKRTIVSRGGTFLTNALTGTTQTDMTSGFELFSRAALEMVLEKGVQSRAHFFQTEIKFHCRNLRFVEVPIHYRSPSPRLGAASVKDAFRQLWRLRSER